MPRPRRGESKDHFMHRCMIYPDLQNKPQDQRVAICESLWAERPGKKSFHVSRRSLTPYSYKIAPTLEALDIITPKEPTFDQGKMSATGVLSTNGRDREGDVIEVEGIWTVNHQACPIAMLDHGVYYPIPIGKTEDPDGNYSVVIDPEVGECLQTTYFSQSSPVAEQVYHLIVERILRGNSIGFDTIEAKRIPPTPAYPQGGKHILRCELQEVTWCGLPCNPEAVRAVLSRDRICGKSITPVVRQLLSPFAERPQVWSPGAAVSSIRSAPEARETEKNPMSKPAKADRRKNMSSLDQTQGGALVSNKRKADLPDDELDDVLNDVAQDDAAEDEVVEQETPELPGAEFLRCVFGRLQDLLDYFDAEGVRQEEPKVKEVVGQLEELWEKGLEVLEDSFEKIYPDLDPLAPPEDDAEAAEDDSAGEEDAEDDADEGEKSKKPRVAKTQQAPAQKRFTKSQAGAVKEAADFLDEHKDAENLTRQQKAGVSYHAKCLKDMLAQPAEEKGEEMSPDEAKEYKRLERKAARQLRLLKRLSLG